MLPTKCYLLNIFKHVITKEKTQYMIHEKNKKETQFIQYDLLRMQLQKFTFQNTLCKTNTIQTCHKEHNESHVQASLGLTASYIY